MKRTILKQDIILRHVDKSATKSLLESRAIEDNKEVNDSFVGCEATGFFTIGLAMAENEVDGSSVRYKNINIQFN